MTKKRALIIAIVLLLIYPTFALAQQTVHLAEHAYVVLMIQCTVLVLFMTAPGIVLFYGGMVQRKNVLSIFAQCMAISALVSVFWLLIGYSLVYGKGNIWSEIASNLQLFSVDHSKLLHNAAQLDAARMIKMVYQMGFAIISVVIIIGGFAERMKFSATLIFAPLWLLIVYCPIANWVWGNGWLQQMGVMDFAGGSVVHINAGIAGLIAAIMLKERKHKHNEPNSLVLVTMGTGILWIGWFGFNGGSATSLYTATLAILNTQVAPAAAAMTWMFVEWIHRGKPSARGLLFGIISGLVAITPAAGYCSPIAALVLGVLSSLVCYAATLIKNKIAYDDALDAFGIHGVAGIMGSLLTGLVASTLFGGVGYAPGVNMLGQLSIQFLDVFAVLIWSGACTYVILWLIQRFHGLRVSEEVEAAGLDQHEHGESVANID